MVPTALTRIPILFVGRTLRTEYMSSLHEHWWDAHISSDMSQSTGYFRWTILVLDTQGNSVDALHAVADLRSKGFAGAVLYLTDGERIPGAAGGGDEILARPYSLEQLAAALRRIARRHPRAPDCGPPPVLRVNNFSINEDTYEVVAGGQPVRLGGFEYELLRFLIRFPNVVHSHQHLFNRVWPLGSAGGSAIIGAYVSSLRRKLSAADAASCLQTVRGRGIRLNPSRLTGQPGRGYGNGGRDELSG